MHRFTGVNPPSFFISQSRLDFHRAAHFLMLPVSESLTRFLASLLSDPPTALLSSLLNCSLIVPNSAST